ncbi:MAG TPA: DinB family protein [Candidatus Dormibacteraeota bacterium]|nr:DinB family protein [Candidatus Dormibacteraeota bacterium]
MKKNVVGLAIILAFSLSPLAARAQQNPVTSAVRAAVSEHAKILVAGAEEMPADKYNYAPTPQQMTFGRMVLHVAQSNGFLCSRISGEKAPMIGHLTEKSPKGQLIAAMKSSFNFCEQALGKVNDGDLSQQVQLFGGRMMSKAGAMIHLANDLADHYAQEAMYLRLNGHLPPTGEGPLMKREMMKGHMTGNHGGM